MKKTILSAALLAALAGQALAADIPARTYSKAPAYTAPAVVYNWTGFYIGGHVGGAFAGDNSLQSSDARFLGGVQAGFDYQFAPNWVLGIEGQYSWLSSNNNNVAFNGAGAGFVYNHNQRALGSVTGRLGYTWGPALLYVKGGYAYSSHSETLAFNGAAQAFALNGSHHDGYTVGTGLEYMFAQNWSGKVEYQYYDFGKTSFVTPAPLVAFGSTRNDEHTVKAGINYRFNLGGPVVAKY